MIVIVKALIVVLLGIVVAAIIRPRLADDHVSWRLIAFWVLANVIAFLEPTDIITLGLLAILFPALAPPKYEHRAAFILCAVPAIPLDVDWIIALPGGMILFNLTTVFVASLTVLLPLWIMSGAHRPKDWQPPVATDILVLLIWATTSYLTVRGIQFSGTVMLRSYVVQFVVWVIPYFALSRALASEEAMKQLLRGVLTVGAIFAITGAVTGFMQWNVWNHATELSDFYSTQNRGNFLRVVLTANPPLAGLFLTIGTLIFLYTRNKSVLLGFVAYGLALLAVYATYRTGSRAAYIGLFLAFATVFFLKIRNWPARIGIGLVSVIAAAAVYTVLAQQNFDTIDEFNTFDYRARLMELSIEHIAEYPLFGQPDYALNPRFEPLRQGQGIIDFVNTYLLYALKWGLYGLALMLVLFGRTLFGFVRGFDRFSSDPITNERLHSPLTALGLGAAGVFVALLFQLFATSDISFYPFYVIGFIGLGTAYRQYSLCERTTETAPSTLETSATPAPASTLQGVGAALGRSKEQFSYVFDKNPRLHR